MQSERTFIRLSDELEIVKSYLDIERLRLGPRLETRIDIDEAALAVQIPVLCIQPLVENAIKHGVAPRAGPGLISVTANVIDDEKLLIAVEDNGAGVAGLGPSQDRSGAGVGLANVRRRLELCFGPQADLVIDSGPAGTRAQFAIPLNPTSRALSGEVVTYNAAR